MPRSSLAVITPRTPAYRGGYLRSGASGCLETATRSQNFQSPNWAHFFWSRTYLREQLGASKTPDTFPEPNPRYLRELTENQRMRWITFRRGREYIRLILWKHTRILYTLNKSPVHVCAPVRLCIIIYHCLPVPSALSNHAQPSGGFTASCGRANALSRVFGLLP